MDLLHLAGAGGAEGGLVLPDSHQILGLRRTQTLRACQLQEQWGPPFTNTHADTQNTGGQNNGQPGLDWTV